MKENQLHHCLGIDFGTTNSHFSEAPIGSFLSHKDIYFDKSTTVPTCLLAKIADGTKTDPVFGQAALEHWQLTPPKEREQYYFASNFKADLAASKQAKEDATLFLSLAAARITTHLNPKGFGYEQGRPVVIGIPAFKIDNQAEVTSQIAKEAGFGEVELIPEPVGALLYHLAQKDITMENAHKGVLVIDFGGGTFDVAYLFNFQVATAWGNPMLGGRLFDDLFFQWFLDLNGGEKVEKRLLRDRNLDYVRMVICREIKEDFSNYVTGSSTYKFNRRITVGLDCDYGRMTDLVQDEFEQRARNYRPSQYLLQDIGEGETFLKREKIDLIAACQNGLLDAPDAFPFKDLNLVILAGGSSKWYFIQDLLVEQLELTPDQIMVSAEPEAAVSRGLAYYIPLKEREKRVKAALMDDKDRLLRELEGIYHQQGLWCAREIGERVKAELYLPKIVPLLTEFREKGGRIKDLERQTEETVLEFGSRLTEIINEELKQMGENMSAEGFERLSKWFKSHQVDIPFKALHIQSVEHKELNRFGNPLKRALNDLNVVFAGLNALITSSILGSLAGGGGIALISSGPVGIVIGIVVGLVLSALGFVSLDSRIKESYLPSWLLKLVLWDARMDEIIKKGAQDTKQSIENILLKSIAAQKDNVMVQGEDALNDIIRTVTVPVRDK